MLNKSKGQDKTNRITEIDEHIRRNFDILKVIFQNLIQSILCYLEIGSWQYCQLTKFMEVNWLIAVPPSHSRRAYFAVVLCSMKSLGLCLCFINAQNEF